MEIIELNKQTLETLKEEFPESINDLRIEGNMLVYGDQSVDISNFNIKTLLNDQTQFLTSLSVLSSEDVFRIVRLHAMFLNSSLGYADEEQKENPTQKAIDIIKRENPLMKNISLVTRHNGIGTDEFINIVDNAGHDFLFRNDRNVNVFAIYETLKYQNAGRDITPDELIDAINRKLYRIELESARDMEERSDVSEDFSNKIKRVNEKYKNDRLHNVSGNEEHDIAVISDLTSPEGHKVVTFNKNEFGDLVVENHGQNVSGVETQQGADGNYESISSDNSVNGYNHDEKVEAKKEDEIVARLISSQEFYRLLDGPGELSQEQSNDVDLYYSYIGDLITYEDYLLPELRNMLNEFRAYVYDLQYGERSEAELNNKQQNAIVKSEELEAKKNNNIPSEEMKKVEENVKKLELIRENSQNNNASNGSVSTLQVISFIVGIAIVLTAITLYLIG